MNDNNHTERMSKSERREIRSFGGVARPHLREAADGGESRTIEGYAIVFGVESRMIVDWCDAYREIIEPGAVTAEDLAKWDIKMTLWHNRERLLARSNKGEGTLRLEVDQTGVKYAFEAPRTVDGETALELVRRGDLSGSSFTYWSDESTDVSYEKADDGAILRHVRRLGYVSEMTIASDPAYTQTSVTARELPEGLSGADSGEPVQTPQGPGPGFEAIRKVREYISKID